MHSEVSVMTPPKHVRPGFALRERFRQLTEEQMASLMPLTPVGASNPYALAQVIALKHGEDLDWADYPNPGDAIQKLETVLETSYENLFV
ncbi:MAG TPA: hypothetical protein VLL74_04615, partial [Methanoregula sp.]|nr:hypothetical protein [Methanoregula sp.]